MVYAVIELQLWRWHWLFLGDFLLLAAKGCLVNLCMSLLPQRSVSRNPVHLSWGMFKLLGSMFPEFSLLHRPFLSYWCLSVGRAEAELITKVQNCTAGERHQLLYDCMICLRSLSSSLCEFTLGWPWSVELLQCLCVEPRPTLRCISCKRVFSWKMWPAGLNVLSLRRDFCFCDHTLTKLSRHCRVTGGCDQRLKVQDINLKCSWNCLLIGQDFWFWILSENGSLLTKLTLASSLLEI